ncbi:sodium-dependent transporter bedraggled isoform X2 [Chrysoperla carnea]|uniref:sodium-dependent transporter bedraggled isoform X2 n=1 Tax=Chrysoperla carnea TaxID=189513 RepID=UPI001D0698D8|nr:sodium-dependent transporter bedraggled isoform X2 [Chrysoperla carnea]
METDVNNITELTPEPSQSINNSCGTSSIVPSTTDDNHSSEMSKNVENEIKQERSWLRSSMRRLRHFRLPDTEDIPSTNNTSTNQQQQRIISTPLNVTVATPSIIEQTTSVLQQPMDNFRHTHRRVRPTSAPNRLSFSQDFQINRQISVHPAGDTGEGVVQNFNVNPNTNSVLLVNRSRSTNRGYRSSSNGRSSSSDLHHHHHHGARSSSESSRSRRPRSVSSTDSSIDEGSSIDTTSSCTPTGTPTRNTPDITASSQSRRVCDHTTGSTIPTNGTHTSRHHRVEENTNVSNNRATNTGRPPGSGSGGGGGGGTSNRNNNNNNNNNNNEDHQRSPIGHWKHRLSSMLASLGCTLGIFNISRFAILSIHFGANFIVQFMVLSVVFGIPLFTLHTCLGQQLNAGVIDMWRISPIFQGVGIALLVAQALIGMYSIIGVSWLFVFFRDSFITKMDNYKWAEPFDIYRYDQKNENGTYKITETVPDYFNGQVLQRYSLAGFDSDSFGNNVKFQVCFNLAVVWIIIFVSLSKGLKSYGKVVFLFTLVPLFCTFILCAKLLGLTPTNSRHGVFSQTSWPEFFLNTKCWVAAFQEAFLTWGLFGAAAMQIASHNKHKHLLQRDTGLVVVITCTVLLLAAFLANTCVEVLQFYGYNYLPGSFETTKSYIFMRNVRQPLPPSLATTPVRYMMHSSLILGERVIRPGIDRGSESGYQPLRFATELIPATFTIIGPDQLSPFWAVLFYFIMILFGISQQLAIWHCVITGIIAIKAKVLKSWQMSITFFSCVTAFLIGIMMTTEYGIYAVYFFDYCVGGTWWLSVLYMVFVSAVFMVRGRPYSGDSVVTALFTPGSHACLVQWAAPLLSFIWNVVLPVALVVYCISTFRNGNFRELYTWHHAPAYDYWALWARQLGSLLQLLPILTVPIAAFVQSYRYLNKGPPDILDRIQLLYRPPLDSEHMEDLSSYTHSRGAQTNTTNSATATDPAFEDPPPKYTPPPSYTTATGARIAKLLRQSIRRSVRRLANVLGESSESRDQQQQQNNQQQLSNIQQQLEPPPPDYAAVLVEMNQSPHVAISISDTTELPLPPTVRNVYNSETNRSSTIDRRTHNHNSSSTLTAAEVASILRSSIRRSTIRAANTLRRSVVSEESTSGSLSVVCLVDGAEPIGQDSLTMDQIQKDNIKNENLSSVI